MSTVTGESFEALVMKVTQERLDSEKIKELLDPEQLRSVTKVIEFAQIKCNRINGDKPKFKVPNLANATPEGLVDMLGEVREQMKDLKKLEGIYKEALEARMKD